MRPRVFPAEDIREEVLPAFDALTSMRPRVFPAEDLDGDARGGHVEATSMRPRVFPAEDLRINKADGEGFSELQ